MAVARVKKRPKRPAFAASTWAALADAPSAAPARFDPATLDALPAPAQRFLEQALPAGVALSTAVVLGMEGEIKLGDRWLGFTAEQILRAATGLVWAPTVGGRVLRFTGADAFGPACARVEFRLLGCIPVVRAAGPDVLRSAQGRLAAETVAWLPQALAPQSGARWRGIDDDRAGVTVDAAGKEVDVEVAVDDDGRIRSLELQRWRDSAEPPAYAPFGGTVDSTWTTGSGVNIAGSGTVGWDLHTPRQADGVFFRYRITAADFVTEQGTAHDPSGR